LASGKVAPLGVGTWHGLSLEFQGGSVTARIDQVALPAISDSSYAKGMVGVGVNGYVMAQFDNFKVDPLKPRRRAFSPRAPERGKNQLDRPGRFLFGLPPERTPARPAAGLGRTFPATPSRPPWK
jgi:hypothetical protein